jgi:hypothetical protein
MVRKRWSLEVSLKRTTDRHWVLTVRLVLR